MPQNMTDQHFFFCCFDSLHEFQALIQSFADGLFAQHMLVVCQAVPQNSQMGAGIGGDNDVIHLVTFQKGKILRAPVQCAATVSSAMGGGGILVHNGLDSDVIPVIDIE